MIFYESFYEAAKYLNQKDRERFFAALLEYGCEGKVPEDLTGIPMAMFLMAKPLLDANAARKAGGALGGRPRKDGQPPRRRANKFDNFESSGTDWDETTRAIMNAQAKEP